MAREEAKDGHEVRGCSRCSRSGGRFHQCEVRHTQRIEQLRIFEHFAYCVFLTRITYCVLRIAYCCHFHIQFEPHSYCVLRVLELRICPPTFDPHCVLRRCVLLGVRRL